MNNVGMAAVWVVVFVCVCAPFMLVHDDPIPTAAQTPAPIAPAPAPAPAPTPAPAPVPQSPQSPVVGSADRSCGPMKFWLGSSGTREYVTSTDVTHDASGWSVVHHMSNGNTYWRTGQYAVTDNSSASVTEWSGPRRTNPAFTMHGVLFNEAGRMIYEEEVFHNGTMIGHTSQDCGDAETSYAAEPPSPARVTAPPSTPTYSGDDSVPITTQDGNQAIITVGMGSTQVQMIIDTGAVVLMVPNNVSDELIARGDATPVWTDGGGVAKQGIGMADGHSNWLRQLTIHTLTIGSHVLHEVPAVASNDDRGMSLLPYTVLTQLGKVTIDKANGKLSFGG